MAEKKRVRVRRTKEAILTAANKRQLGNQLDEIVEMMREVAELNEKIKQETEAMETMMQKFGIKEYNTLHGEAEIETPAPRATTVIDPALFKDLVTDEEFMECVSIGVTKAKKVITGRDLDKVSERKMSAPKPAKLVIKPIG